MINIVIFGAPGVGKGTQAQLLAEKFDFLHISTGELLRNEVAAGTPVGLRVADIMNRGDLVGDDIVLNLLAKALEKGSVSNTEPDQWDVERGHLEHRPEGCIVDGYPRTVAQAQTLEFLFRKLNKKIDLVVAIDVPRDELVRRIHERAAISGRADDTEEVIRHRLEQYDEKTRPVLDYYRVSGHLVSVDASGEIADTNQRLCKVVEGAIARLGK